MTVNGFKIEVGQLWRTRGGELVRITRRFDKSFVASDGGLRDEQGVYSHNAMRSLNKLETEHETKNTAKNLQVGDVWHTRMGDIVELVGMTASGFLGDDGIERDIFGRAGLNHPKDLQVLHRKAQTRQQTGSAANTAQVGGDHYKTQPIQPWDYIIANGLGFLAGNVVKYVTRFDKKNGVEDLEKARHYLDKLIELEKSK